MTTPFVRRRMRLALLVAAAATLLASASPPPASAAHGGHAVVIYCNWGVKLGFPAGYCGFFARHSWNANYIEYSGGSGAGFAMCAGIHTGYPVSGSNRHAATCTFNGQVIWIGNNAENFYYLGGYNGDRGPHTFYPYGVN